MKQKMYKEKNGVGEFNCITNKNLVVYARLFGKFK